jgi:hypothetical protein
MNIQKKINNRRIAQWQYDQTKRKIERICQDLVMVHIPRKGAHSVAFNTQTEQVHESLPSSFGEAFHQKARKWDIYCLSITPFKHNKEYQVRVGGFTCKAPYNLETLFQDMIADFHISNHRKDNPTLKPFMVTIIAPRELNLSDEQIDNILARTDVFITHGINRKGINYVH